MVQIFLSVVGGDVPVRKSVLFVLVVGGDGVARFPQEIVILTLLDGEGIVSFPWEKSRSLKEEKREFNKGPRLFEYMVLSADMLYKKIRYDSFRKSSALKFPDFQQMMFLSLVMCVIITTYAVRGSLHNTQEHGGSWSARWSAK
ncbi:hypothetical protein HAX54_015308 [Datura stramonium]|uniref:Uncharacterized protein n=1 Tax=Datura stramonium TaxID=4076 RepID=A0ABS8TSW0_DATST|nr:hypothetical protein [Datura stramonium]